MSKAEGIYLSVDYRVTDARTGRKLDDESVKFLIVHYPPQDGGVKALFAYTGIARLPDGTRVGDWIRETLRGESEIPDVSMRHLRERLDRDIAPLKHGLIINILALQGDKRHFGAFTNMKTDGTLRDAFDYGMYELAEPIAFCNGSGGARVLADGHIEALNKQRRVLPRRPHDHMNLLASINRKVAQKDSTVSPFCHVAFINGDDRYEPEYKKFLQRGEILPFHAPIMHFGIDFGSLTEMFFGAFEAGREPTLDPDELNKLLKRRD
jgi:hypothetical protein